VTPSSADLLRVGCVIVDYHAGAHLHDAVTSVLDAGVHDLVVVDNAGGGATRDALGDLAGSVRIVEPGRNLGFGAGVNRGVAVLGPCDLVLVANPDIVLHAGALDRLAGALALHPEWCVVGPTILNESGAVYPSVRTFPSLFDAVGHALLGRVWPANPCTRRYRESGGDAAGNADWVSGACFLADRAMFGQLGGFDERYFMFAEDMDLCWRAHKAGRGVGSVPEAVVTHVEGVSRRSAPYRMQVEHHKSALRFAAETTSGPARLLLPIAAAVLAMRLLAVLALARLVPADA